MTSFGSWPLEELNSSWTEPPISPQRRANPARAEARCYERNAEAGCGVGRAKSIIKSRRKRARLSMTQGKWAQRAPSPRTVTEKKSVAGKERAAVLGNRRGRGMASRGENQTTNVARRQAGITTRRFCESNQGRRHHSAEGPRKEIKRAAREARSLNSHKWMGIRGEG